MIASLDRSNRLLRPFRPAHGEAAIGQGQWSLPQHQWLKVNTDGARSVRVLKDTATGYLSIKWYVKELCSRSWTVHINHIKRSGNNVADKLAKNANLDCLKPTFFATPPPWVTSLVIEDVHN
ncbi:hypothetical protein V6N12_041180 [Hibiscus sabdariffa]|uniref:RNase H type-1 domain-containing protein n=1 Tax=Hibiscus sabdariffa TaxID=183260 RepID=A0ABR2E7R4_9ROSI